MKASIPKHIGFEIELGNHWVRTGKEKSAADAAAALVAVHHRLYAGQTDGRNEPANEFDREGFRVYLDHEHAEICSPLVPSARRLVLAMRDARRIVMACKKAAEEEVEPLRISYNNTNRQGAAWGFHLNVLVSRRVFDGWRDGYWLPLKKHWIPFLVTSLPLLGTGKVGAENGTPPCTYQLMQRGDFISQEVGLETVGAKSLVNTRDEPLADPDRYARFHIIAAGDTNLCEFANWLKFGTAQVLLALIEEGVTMPSMALDDPVHAMHAVSRDLVLQRRVGLRSGRHESALGVQRRLAEAAARAIETGCAACQVPDAELIVRRWIETLDDLEARRARLSRRLDWCAKLNLLQRAQELGKADRQRTLLFDLQYAEVGGIFEKLEAFGAVDRLEDFLPRKSFTRRRTAFVLREQARAVLINRFGRHLACVHWDHVAGRDKSGRLWIIPMDDPLGGQNLLRITRSAENWSACLGRLIKTGLATQPVADCTLVSENGRNIASSPVEELSVLK